MYNEFDAMDNHKLKCKYCGQFMKHIGSNSTEDDVEGLLHMYVSYSTSSSVLFDTYICSNPKCKASADVCNDFDEHQIFWNDPSI